MLTVSDTQNKFDSSVYLASCQVIFPFNAFSSIFVSSLQVALASAEALRDLPLQGFFSVFLEVAYLLELVYQ